MPAVQSFLPTQDQLTLAPPRKSADAAGGDNSPSWSFSSTLGAAEEARANGNAPGAADATPPPETDTPSRARGSGDDKYAKSKKAEKAKSAGRTVKQPKSHRPSGEGARAGDEPGEPAAPSGHGNAAGLEPSAAEPDSTEEAEAAPGHPAGRRKSEAVGDPSGAPAGAAAGAVAGAVADAPSPPAAAAPPVEAAGARRAKAARVTSATDARESRTGKTGEALGDADADGEEALKADGAAPAGALAAKGAPGLGSDGPSEPKVGTLQALGGTGAAPSRGGLKAAPAGAGGQTGAAETAASDASASSTAAQSPASKPGADAQTADASLATADVGETPGAAKGAPKSGAKAASDEAAPSAGATAPAGAPPNHAARAPADPAAAPPEVRFAEANHAAIVSGVTGGLLPHGGSMQIRLDPPEFGALQVTVELRDGVISASFQTSNDDATRLLSHSLGQLKEALQSQGVHVQKLQVQQAPKPQASGEDGHAHNGGDSRSPQDQRQEQQRRELMQRLWRRLSVGSDPLDLVA